MSTPMTDELVLKRILRTWHGKVVDAAKATIFGRALIDVESCLEVA